MAFCGDAALLSFRYVLNRFVDMCFIFDIGLQFFMSYFDAKTETWIYDLKKIRMNYMKGWFIIDFISW